jgi:hypothetical protein
VSARVAVRPGVAGRDHRRVAHRRMRDPDFRKHQLHDARMLNVLRAHHGIASPAESRYGSRAFLRVWAGAVRGLPVPVSC